MAEENTEETPQENENTELTPEEYTASPFQTGLPEDLPEDSIFKRKVLKRKSVDVDFCRTAVRVRVEGSFSLHTAEISWPDPHRIAEELGTFDNAAIVLLPKEIVDNIRSDFMKAIDIDSSYRFYDISTAESYEELQEMQTYNQWLMSNIIYGYERSTKSYTPEAWRNIGKE